MMKSPLRIVVTGPESTGKSMLVEALGRRLGLPYALEYARAYLEQHGPEYDADRLLNMSREHKRYQEQRVPPRTAFGLFDTDLINYVIWSRVAYGTCHPAIKSASEAEQHHVYLLCAPDIPWTPDPLREHPQDREYLFAMHRDEIERLGRRYALVQGTGEERVRCAEQAIRPWLEAARLDSEPAQEE